MAAAPPGLVKLVVKPRRWPSQAELLHHGGRDAAWANLGLWPLTETSALDTLQVPDYASACAALADAVAAAAGPLRGQRVLAPGCGSGQELLHWVLQHGAREAVGIDTDTGTAEGQPLPPQAQLLRGSAMDMAAALRCGAADSGARAQGLPADTGPPAAFDALLCVDAAYHFWPRTAWLQGSRALLRPGGRIAFTDLVLDAAPGAGGLGLKMGARWLLGPAVRLAARTAGVHPAGLLPLPAALRRLEAAGFEDVCARRLDADVLDGFVNYVQRQRALLMGRARGPAWRRVAATARLIPLSRAAGLGYVLFSATALGPAAGASG